MVDRPLVVMASANPDKVAEIADLMADVLEILPRPTDIPDVVEDASTLLGNARLKARAIATATGLAAIADDTGLEIDAIGGAPGVRTARFAGENASYSDNVAKTLDVLDGVEVSARTARFRTVALLGYPDGREVIGEGVAEGMIARAPSGTGGFGYDPIFIPAESDGRTFAEMPSVLKNEISHRGRAFRELRSRIADSQDR